MKTSLKFKTSPQLAQLIDQYFLYIKGEFKLKPVKTDKEISRKVWTREPEPPTLCNLALFLGFNSMEEYHQYEQKSKYLKPLNYARLRIEAAYEQLLFEKPTAAIFALKSMIINEKVMINSKLSAENNNTLKVEIIHSGPNPAGSEKEVVI